MKRTNYIKEIVLIALLFCGSTFFSCGSTPDSTGTKPEAPKTEKVSEQKNETSKQKTPAKPKEPEDPPDVAFVKKLQAELNKGNINGALELFNAIPENLANDKGMNILHASLYISAGQYDKAKKIATDLLNDYPSDIEVLELLSVIARASGNKSDYKTYSNKILEIDPYNAEVNIQVAQDYVMNRKYKQARTAYKNALVNEPKNVDALFGYAQMDYFIGDVKEAREIFLQVLDIEPTNATNLSYLGKIAAENDNYLSAIKYVQEAIKYDSKNYNFHMDLGKYYQRINKPKDAIKEWETARDLDPTYFLAYAYLAGINDELNNYDVALANYKKVIETNPNYYYAYESTAILEWHFGNWAESRKYFTLAYDTSGKKDWSYALMIAATYMKEKNNFKAKEWLQPIMKKMDRESLEYQMMKFYYDNYSRNAASLLVQKINKEENSTKRGKLWFYMGLYNEIYAGAEAAADMYTKVTSMQAPMFFEYRMAEWGLGINGQN